MEASGKWSSDSQQQLKTKYTLLQGTEGTTLLISEPNHKSDIEPIPSKPLS
jgi:hypothetical protein